MICTVVACGDSAKGWIPRGTTIGSNDVLKWGTPVDYLILCNSPLKFKPERLSIIKKTKAKVLVTSVNHWKPIFPSCERIQKMTSFNKMIVKGFVQTSVTSPIMCLGLALRFGATEVIIYGVDFKNHSSYSQGTKRGDQEIEKYKRYFKEMNRLGVKVWRGADGSVFDNYLPLWID